VNYNIEMRVADRKNEPITLNIRLDNLIRIFDSLMGSSASSGQHRSNSHSPASVDYVKLALKPYGVQRSTAKVLPLPAIVNEIKLQLIVNRIIFCSWPSAKNYFGIASLQEYTDLQIRLIRKNGDKLFPTNIINNTVSTPTGMEEMSGGRWWEYFPGNRRLIALKNNSELIDEKSFPLVVDHLFCEILFGEIYCREWTTKNLGFHNILSATRKREFSSGKILVRPSSFGNNTADQTDNYRDTESPSAIPKAADGNDDSNSPFEPKSVDDITDLFKPIHRLAHASRVIISLTDTGEVSTRSNLFVFSGILQKREETENIVKPSRCCDLRALRKMPAPPRVGRATQVSDFMIGREWRRKSSEMEGKGPLSEKNKPSEKTGRPSLSEFRKLSLERHATISREVDHNESGLGLHRSTPRGLSTRKSLLIPQKSRAESAETVKESLLKKRRESIIKLDNNPFGRAPSSARKSSVAGTNRRLKWSSTTTGYKATLRDFVANHSAFTPPSCALPAGYRGHQIRSSSNSNQLFNKGTYTDKFGYLNGLKAMDSNQSSFGNKILGLKVIDCRILFTINIRDVLYSYTTRAMDLFSPNESDDNSSAAEKRGEAGEGPGDGDGGEFGPDGVFSPTGAAGSRVRRPSTIAFAPANKEKERVTLSDFLAVNEDKAQPAMRKKHKRRTAMGSLPEENSRTGSSGDHSIQQNNKDNNQNSSGSQDLNSVSLSPMTLGRSRSKDTSEEVSSVTEHFQLNRHDSADFSQTDFSYNDVYPEMMGMGEKERERGGGRAGGDQSPHLWSDDRTTLRGRVYKTGGRGLRRTSNAGTKGRASIQRGFSFNEDENSAAEIEEEARLQGLATRSKSLLDFGLNNPPSLGATPRGMGMRSSLLGSKSMSPLPHSSSATPGAPPKKKIPINQHFFVVELVDPQINFLDADKHGSLIIVAGRSSMEGKRLNTAILPPSSGGGGGGDSGEAIEPKRRQEIRLRMDGVSAFTVPTLINYNENNEDDGQEFEDEVFWKHLKSTSDTLVRPAMKTTGLLDNNKKNKNQNKSSTDRGVTFEDKDEDDDQNNKKNNSSDNIEVDAELMGVDSPFMKTAISDFQIRALYIFWTEVTAAEAKELYVQQSKEALAATFRLELPELAVDIFSWQFYIILNVIRNVLLVPPPASASSKRSAQMKSNEAAEEQEQTTVELPRDSELLNKFDIKNPTATLDINKRQSCEEIRVIIEEYLRTAMDNPAISRFVEVFIGRVYWKLRTNANKPLSSVSEKEGRERDGSVASPSATNSNTATNTASGFLGSLSPTSKLRGGDSSKKKNRKSTSGDQELVEAALTGIYTTLTFFEDR
jgi:hypothetical protein